MAYFCGTVSYHCHHGEFAWNYGATSVYKKFELHETVAPWIARFEQEKHFNEFCEALELGKISYVFSINSHGHKTFESKQS